MLYRWSRDGKELYYAEGGAVLLGVSVSTGQGVALGQPRQLFRSDNLFSSTASPMYDISTDVQRFLTIAPVEADGEETAPPTIRIIEDWYEEFRDRER